MPRPSHSRFISVVSIIASFSGANASASGPIFSPESYRITQRDGLFYVVADVDGDGFLDITTPARVEGDSELVVLINDRAGGFVPRATGLSRGGWIDFDVGDLDGDGLADLAVIERDGAWGDLVLYFGSADGSFVEQARYPIKEEPFNLFEDPLSIDVVDLDGDGDLDVFTSIDRIDESASLRNEGNRTFSPAWREISIDYPVFADIDGDGDRDIVTGQALGSTGIRRFRNDGDGVYTELATVTLVARFDRLRSADMDGDGDDDLITSSFDDAEIGVLRSENGAFPGVEHFALPGGRRVQDIGVGDIDADGDPDILAAGFREDDGSVSWTFINDGDGGFALGFECARDESLVQIEFPELDGDGTPEIVAHSGGGRIMVYEGVPGSTLTSGSRFALIDYGQATQDGIRGGILDDLNGDGHADSAFFGTDGSLGVALTDIDGAFLTPGFLTVPGAAEDLSSCDLDEDGFADLVIAVRNFSPGATNSVTILYGDADGDFNRTDSVPTVGFPVASIPVDLDLDGDPDLVIATVLGLIVASRNDQGDYIQAGEVIEASLLDNASPTALDWNLDGLPDIAIIAGGNQLQVFSNNGDGTLADPLQIGVAANYQCLAAGDWDADGRTDLAATVGDDLEILFNRDGLGFERIGVDLGVLNGPLLDPSQVMATDADGDGDEDLIVLDASTAILFLNDGSGGFDASRWIGTGPEPRGIAFGPAGPLGTQDLAVFTDGNARSFSGVTVLQNLTRGCSLADVAPPIDQLDLADISVFVTGFVAGDAIADLAPPTGVLDLADVSAFLDAFVAGCD